MTPEEQVEHLVKHIAGDVKKGFTPEEAASRLALIVDQVAVEAALARFREIASKTKILTEPDGILNQTLESWYLGPADDDRYWPAFKNHLLRSGWAQEAVAAIADSSTKIVSCLSHPGQTSIRTRGLVIGHVQSGKTASYTSVIAKAADAGYRLFIVLSGLNNALRNQTQRRLEADLSLNSEHWIMLTAGDRDFRATENVNFFLGGDHSGKALGVIKKNSGRLKRLRDWLRGAHAQLLRGCPVLIIDDEADEASPNSHPDPNERTRINKLIVELLALLPKSAYVGYTATPFANLLIDPEPVEDLYPRDFIIDLPRSAEYFGPERIFGRAQLDWDSPDEAAEGLDMIRVVPQDEADRLHPVSAAARFTFRPEISGTIASALRYYWLATAARHARGQDRKHSSMLIHTTQYAAAHDSFREPVEAYRAEVAAAIKAGSAEVLAALEEQWTSEQALVPAKSLGQLDTKFDDLLKHLHKVVAATEVVIENGSSSARLDYEQVAGDPGRVYVVVGGNVLSRGLTLEGLCVSFFIRAASAYDTLLQMGRWFGYRPGYADLPRVWMTEELRTYFFDLATVEREIRYDIARYQASHITPLNFGVRIRQHPHLAITSKLKMQKAVRTKMSFAGTANQTLVFKHLDSAWLNKNLTAAKTLIAQLRAAGAVMQRLQNRSDHVYLGVSAEIVLEFLGNYAIHERHVEMPSSLLQGYVREQNRKGRLSEWNVVIISRAGAPLGIVGLNSEEPVGLVNRSRFVRGDLQFADVKALMSELDVVADVDVPHSALPDKKERPQLLKWRDTQVPGRGLLLIYPISKDSKPVRGLAKGRTPLDAAEHVIGIAIVFPAVEDGTPQTYWTAAVPGVAVETADFDEELLAEEAPF